MDWQDLSKVQKEKIHFFGNWKCELVMDLTMMFFGMLRTLARWSPESFSITSIIDPVAQSIFLFQASKGKERHSVKDRF